MAEGFNSGLAHFQILTHGAVLGDVGFGIVPHGLFDCALSGNRGGASGFSPPPCFFQRAAMGHLELPHFGGQFALAQLAAGTALQFRDIGGLFSAQAGALSAQLPFGHTAAATAVAGNPLPTARPSATA